jgi:carboxymethylenebutenolidase
MDRIYVRQLVRSLRLGHLSRREFLVRATAAVGALAAQQLLLACGNTPADAPQDPVVQEETPEETAAAAITSDEGLTTETVTYPDQDGEELMGFLARPADAEALPGVIVIQEWWGLNEHIRDVTRRFAQAGFVALAPDLYKGVTTTEPDEAQKLVMELDQAEAVREIGQAMAFLREQAYVAGEDVGVVGFCLGGALALQTALANDNLGAAVAFYGRPLEPAEAGNVNAPVLGLYGAEDGSIPVSAVEAMAGGFADANVEHKIEIYDGAGHAFFNDTRDSYDADAAEDAWERTLSWFATHLPAA